MVVTGCGVGCVLEGVGVWLGGFWTSGIVYVLVLTISMSTVSLTQFDQNLD